jgi:hypothetical protein
MRPRKIPTDDRPDRTHHRKTHDRKLRDDS